MFGLAESPHQNRQPWTERVLGLWLAVCCALLASLAESPLFAGAPKAPRSTQYRAPNPKQPATYETGYRTQPIAAPRFQFASPNENLKPVRLDDLSQEESGWWKSFAVGPLSTWSLPSIFIEPESRLPLHLVSANREQPANWQEVVPPLCPDCYRELLRSQYNPASTNQSLQWPVVPQPDPLLAPPDRRNANEILEHIEADPDDLTRTLSFREDIGHAWYRLKDDIVGIMQPRNLAVLGMSAAGAIAIHQDLDGQVRDHTARHPRQWREGDEVLGVMGDVFVQGPVLVGLYFWSIKAQDDELHDVTTTLMSAYAINGVSAVLLKVIVNTDRPSTEVEDGRYGFPSFHAASSFAMASVLNEYYGWQVGVPAYLMAGLVGWTRIDARHHDLSDVMFGAAMGYVIGTSVARHHLTGDSRVTILPWTEPLNRAVGLQFEWRY